jgi:hypothetical protein
MEALKNLKDWPPYSDRKDWPVWFWAIENVRSDLAVIGVEDSLKSEFIQILKKESLKALNMRGNMLNLRRKHIPRIQEIYRSLLESFIIQD